MPELPEVETIVRGLRRAVRGRKIVSVSVPDPSAIHGVSARALSRRLRGAAIESVLRRGKYILFRMDNRMDVVIHLRMTGQLLIGANDWDKGADALTSAFRVKGGASGTHGGGRRQREDSVSVPSCSPQVRDPRVRVRFRFEDGSRLAFRDVRRLGEIRLAHRGDYGEIAGLARVGPEPLGSRFTAEWLLARFAARRAPVKSVLMDQRVGAGIGNIYASELLHAAHIDPRRSCHTLGPDEVRAVWAAARRVLRRAIAREGTTLRDYRGALGARGGYTPRVYNREGRPCRACHTPIRRAVIGGRSAFYCPQCQK